MTDTAISSEPAIPDYIGSAEDFKAVIGSLSVPAYEYRAPERLPERYIVYGYTSAGVPIWADDEPLKYRLRGELWYYSTTAMDAVVHEILTALLSRGADVTVRQIGYDDELSQVVHIMDWSVFCGSSGVY